MADYTRDAITAIRQAVEHEDSVPEWLADVLARVAAAHPDGSWALIAGRPGSWEADCVRRLMAGTVGENDEYLAGYKEQEP